MRVPSVLLYAGQAEIELWEIWQFSIQGDWS